MDRIAELCRKNQTYPLEPFFAQAAEQERNVGERSHGTVRKDDLEGILAIVEGDGRGDVEPDVGFGIEAGTRGRFACSLEDLDARPRCFRLPVELQGLEEPPRTQSADEIREDGILFALPGRERDP